jgi:hypothetical protein
LKKEKPEPGQKDYLAVALISGVEIWSSAPQPIIGRRTPTRRGAKRVPFITNCQGKTLDKHSSKWDLWELLF